MSEIIKSWDEIKKIFESIKQEIIQNPSLYKLNPSIHEWKLGWNQRKRHLGVCVYSSKQIQISLNLIKANGEKIHVIETTLRHEFAHALTPRQNHNEKWKSVFRSLGGDGMRCVKDSNLIANCQSTSKYILQCECSSRPRFKKTSKSYMCLMCKKPAILKLRTN